MRLMLIALMAFTAAAHAGVGEKHERSRGAEDRISDSRSATASMSRSYSVDTLVFPILAGFEVGARTHSALSSTPLAKCDVFDATRFVWDRGTVHEQGNIQTIQTQPFYRADSIAPISAAKLDEVQGDWYLGMTYGLRPPVTPLKRFRCLLAYSAVAEHVVKAFAEQSSQVVTDRLTGARVFQVPGLSSERVLSLIDSSLASPEVQQTYNERMRELEATQECLVPTPSGIASGNTLVRCGRYTYDQVSRTLTRDGVILLSGDTVAGVKVAFSNADEARHETAKSRTTRTEKKREATVVVPK